MGKPAVSIEGISKQYKIGLREKASDSFGEALYNLFTSPIRRLKALGEASTGEDLFWALRDISFEVQRGEVVSIIGANGAGKSTLLKILSRITEPTEGWAAVRGRVGSLLEVGTGFHPELTGRENIFLNGAILGMKKAEIERRFDEIVAFADISKFLDTVVKRYSSGMRVRLGFAVAAYLEPEILIIDEVLAVGDVQFQQKCLGKMQSVAGDGRTVLFVSHNMHSVRQLCSRAVLLDEGRVVMDGEVTEVVDRYMERNLAQEGQIVLDDWDGNRRSPGQARVQAVRTLGPDGEIRASFGIFDPITFEADLINLPENGFVISFNVHDKDRVLVYNVRSQDSDMVTTDAGRTATVRMTIPRLRMTDGTYSVNIWLGNHLDQLEDLVDNVLAFHVVNKGHSVARLPSVIHETGEWTLVRRGNGDGAE